MVSAQGSYLSSSARSEKRSTAVDFAAIEFVIALVDFRVKKIQLIIEFVLLDVDMP